MKKTSISAVFCTLLCLSSCTPFLQQQQQQQTTPTPVAEGQENAENKAKDDEAANKESSTGDSLKDTVPSEEQQAAARLMLENGDSPQPVVSSNAADIPEPIVDSAYDSPYTSSVPGGRGLRMGSIAPPEEAASSGDNAKPKPNSVEMHGLRSPNLPKGLPMDINGKLNPSN